MNTTTISINKIIEKKTLKHHNNLFAVCWIKEKIEGININNTHYKNVSNSIFFLDPKYNWKIFKKNSKTSSGYILYLSKEILNHSFLSNLHINQIKIFNNNEIPLFKLSPGIEKRTQAILEMIDELLGSNLNHKDDAILSLLHTFFVYCDGQCNIKSIISCNNSKTAIVYKYKKLVDKNVDKYHEVSDYAKLLNITSKYLNECVKEVLFVSSKSIIIEQLLMKSRHALKFTDKSIKEICFDLGFSSPDYFSYFFKNHTGITPSKLRKS